MIVLVMIIVIKSLCEAPGRTLSSGDTGAACGLLRGGGLTLQDCWERRGGAKEEPCPGAGAPYLG